MNASTALFSGIDLPTPLYFTFPSDPGASGYEKFSEEQKHILDIIAKLSSSISVLACLISVIVFLSWQRFRTPANRLIFFMLLADTISALCWLVGTSIVNYYDGDSSASTGCQIQAMLLQFSDISSVAFTAAMSCNLLMVLFMTKSARDLTQMEKWYFYLCYGIPFLVAYVPIFINAHDNNGSGLIYGETSIICWISKEWMNLRLFLYFIPVWCIFVFNTTIYAVSTYKVLKKTKHMPFRVSSASIDSTCTSKDDSIAQQINQKSGATANSATPSQASYIQRKHNFNTSQYASVRHGPGSLNGSSIYNGQDRRTITTTSTATSTITSMVSLNTLLSFRKRYFTKIGLFFLAYILAWSVPTVIIVRQLTWATKSPSSATSSASSPVNFVTLLFAASIVPLRGCINFCCYFLPSLSSVMEERRRDLTKLRGIK
jgi:hypothetical protein